jgi:protein gp37
MSDLFQDGVPEDFIRCVFETMGKAHWHSFQVLTKRADRMRTTVARLPPSLRKLPNVWLGVSVENRRHGLPRIEQLRGTPAAIRFLSIEPLLEDLGDIDLRGLHWVIVGGESGPGARPMDAAWVRSVRAQCCSAGVPFFFKQWGGARKSAAGRLLDGETYDAFPRESRIAAPTPAIKHALQVVS